jgi:FtsP/CotA-like multicopper oxidase with cupredoxin domain
MWSIFALFCLFCAICAELVTHDASFVPDIVLEARHRKLNIACETRYSVVINGSSPGPTLHLNEGKSTWIRVYNQLENKNFTIVSLPRLEDRILADCQLALAWPQSAHRTILRWHSTGRSMADSSRSLL